MALQQITSPAMLDSTGQAIVTAINNLAEAGGVSGGGGGASSISIAPIETTTTASKAYAVGDLLFYNNILYKVTSVISQGGTIEISGANPNVVSTDIDSELKTKIKLSNTAGLVKNDGTIDQTSYATAASVTAIKDGTNIDSFSDVETALSGKISTSNTAGLVKNDGSIDESTYLTSSSISGATDSSISSPANKQVLEYNSTSAKWENKAKFTTLTGTIAANGDTVTITNAAITSTARFEVYTEDCYLPLLDISRENTALTLIFPTQESAVNIKVLVYED